MKKHILGILFLFICCTNYLAAQVDTEFWFAAPHISEHSRVTGEYHIILFAYDQSAHVVISMPANSSFVNKEYDLQPYGYVDVIMASDYDDATANFDVPLDVVSQRGIYISSTAKIGGYYQHAGRNSEAFSFKENAVGTDFLVTSQITHVTPNNGAYVNAYSSIQIVATENNTTVTITPAFGHQLGLSCNASPVVVNLNRGETYAIRTCNKDPQYGVNGTRITSNKGITVTTIDDSTQPDYPNSTGADLMGDQIVPITLAGTEYVVIGQLRNWNECFVTAIENGTTVNLGNGSSFTLQKNETRTISMSTIKALYISSNKPIIVYQLTGEENEAAGTVLPKLACTGSPYAVYKKLPNSYSAFLNIVVRAADTGKIYINDNHIASSNFHSIAGTTDWYYAAIDISSYSSDVIRIKSLGGLFQLGALDMIGVSMDDLASCSYGYFSDYGTSHEYHEYATFAEGTTYTWKNHFLPGTTTLMTFTAEGVYTDNQLTDHNGCDSICILHLSKIPYPDNVADIECVVPPIPSDFEMKELYQAQEAISVSTPFVADIDGDGQTEIIASSWVGGSPKFHANRINIYDGRNGTLERSITTPVYNLCGQPLAIADVDRDGKGEMFLLASDMYIYAYNWQGTQIWKSSFTLSDRFMPAVADVNNDGQPELVCGKYIFKPTDGTLLLELTLNPDGMGFGAPNGIASTKGYYSYYMPALTDIDGDGSLEICAGTTIYKLNILNPNGTSGNSFSILRTANTIGAYADWNYDGQTFVVDFDNDGDEDICVIGCNHDVTDNGSPYYIDLYIWDGQTSNIIGYARETSLGHNNGGTWCASSMPFAGDLNGDGYPEILFSMYETAMFAYTYDNSQPNGTRRMHKHVPFAETVGFTVFDFNMDGKSEIVYRGMDELFVADGTTLNYLCTPISIHSQTLTEYPVVADVNGDGVAEIIIANSSDRTVYVGWMSVFGEAKSGAWSSARPVWNQWAYNSVNINEDLTVPQNQYNVATLFPNGTKPYNSFLAQKPIIDKQGDIFVPAADAAITSCTSEVINDSVNITISFCNNGDANLIAPYEIAVYQNEYRGRVVQVDTIKEGLAINGCTSATIKVPALSVCQAAVDNSFVIAVNDDGHGIAQHGNQQAECDTTNNRTSIILPPNLRRDTTYVNIIIEQGQKYTFNGHDYTTDTQDTATFTAASGCDSVCILDLKVIPYPDNVTEVPCTVDPPANVWSIRRSAISTQDLLDDCSTTMVGDIDGDGQVEIIAPINGETMQYEKIGIFDAQANVKRIINIPGTSIFTNIAIAKIKTGEGQYTTLFFFLAYDKYIYAYTPTGTQYWKSDQPFSHNDGELVPIASLSLADFNHDGWAEIYLGSEIFDAATGKRLCAYNGNRGHADRSWKASRQMYQSVAADVMGDSNLELLIGNCVCSVNINSRTDATQNSIVQSVVVPTSLMKMEDNSSIPSTDGFTLSADIDGDGKLDAVVMWIDKSNRVLYVYVWNPRDGTMLGTRKIVNVAEFGTPNIGDIDNDGNLELNFIIGTQPGETTDTNDRIFSLKYNKSTHSLDVFWTLHHDDASGATGLTLFDFNQDGTKEIVYRDCENLRIINGSMKHHLTGAPVAAPYDLATIPCSSGTATEYPVIADVDADGEAEIVVVGEWKLQVYKSNLEPWAPARKVWNQYAYNITNVNEDLTIPQYQYNNAHKFTDASSVVRQPYNTFLSQVTTINSQGVPFIAAADVATTTAIAPSFENDSVTFDVSYCNQGSLQLNAPYSITTYAKTYRGTVLHIDTIYDILSVGDCEQKTVKFPVAALCADASINKLIIAINDDGKGIAQHGEQQAECDTTNNTLSINIPNIHTDTTRFASVICATELPYTHLETGIVFPIGFSKPDSCEKHTNQYGCDSIIQVKITINPTLYGDTTVTIGEGKAFTWHGVDYSTDGHYPYTYTSVVTGCDSIVTLHLTHIPYPDNIVNVDCEVPPTATNFDMIELFKCDSVQPMTTPFVADIDGDGITEIISAKWPEERKLFASDGFVVIDGRNGNAKYTISTVQYPVCGQPVAIADVNNDGKGEIILLDADNYAYCYSYNGTLLWESTFPLDARYTPLLCDFNHDGLPELVFGKYIFNPVSGALLHEINYTTYGKGWSAPHGVSSKPTEKLLKGYYMCALADIDGDGTPEVCAGNTIYSINLVNYSGTSGNSSNVLRQAENISDVQEYDGQTIVVDFDNDGDLDICVLGLSHDMALTFPNPTVSVYIWDGQSSSIIAHTQFLSSGYEENDKTWTGPSIPYCGDLDGDNLPEITFAIKNMGMMSYKYDPTATNHILQVHNHPAFAETCGFSVFDFNKDGRSEIVYRDAYSLSIADGTTLNHLCTPVVAYSGTITEYPVVADVNGDGSAEIIVNRLLYNWDDRTGVRDDVRGWTSVYGSSVSGTWSSARPIWNQWVYTSTCINNDLTVPRYMYNVATQFPNGKKPYNTFLSQVPIIDQQGDIFVPAADAAVSTCSQAVENDSVVITLEYCNNGDAILVAPFEVTVYKNTYRDAVLWVDTIREEIRMPNCTSFTFKIPNDTLCPIKDLNNLLVAINDDGHGIAQHGNQQAECDTTNNTAIVNIPKLQSDTTRFYPVICESELPYTHALSGIVFPVGYISGKDSCITKTNKYGCDSVTQVTLTINPILYGDTAATFCNGHPFKWHGVDYPTGGDYQYTYTSEVTSCDSIVTLHLTQLEPSDSLEVVTICAGASHIWHGNPYTTTTTTTEILTNAAGCDSVCTLQLTVLPELKGDTSATFCNGHPFKWHGVDYPTGGDYPYTYTSKVTGCDSIVTLHLTQLEPTDSIENVTICEGETHYWHGNPYTSTIDITETIDNAVGCDSVCTLKLTVLPAITGDTNMTVCDTLLPVTWRGQSITGAGEYYHTATASSGCDSTITLHVTVETCLTPALTCDTLEATFIVPDICADDDSMYIDITYTKGLPVSYNVTFGADAVAQGFQSSYTGNVRITSSTTASISIPIPNDPTNRQVYPKPNVYSIDISILDTCDAYTTWRSQNFLIHYPSWLTLQRWNDVISLYNERYNGGYVFSQIRWFHEGTLLESRGDHDGYIYQRPTLVYGDAYWAELTRADDGVTITTCPIYPVPMTDSTKMDDVTDPYIIVTPTVVTPSNPTVTVKTNICGEYYVYYVDGHLLDKQNFCPKDNHTFTIDIDPCYVRTGLYILVFYGEEGTIKAVKLLVEP